MTTPAKTSLISLLAGLTLIGAGCVGPVRPLPSVPRIPFQAPDQPVNQAVPDSALISDAPADQGSAPQVATFGTNISLAVGDAAVFDDGIVVRLDKIDGAHCAPGIKCTAPSESTATLRIKGGDFGTMAKVIELDLVAAPEQDLLNYRFSLREAKSGTARIVVDKL